MKKLILVRHTEKDNNHPNQVDNPLTEHGLEQAKSIAKFLDNHPYEIVFTSLMRRANKTAEVINESKKIKIIKSMAFNEYYIREDGENVETTNMGVSRTLTKIYSVADIYDSILIVAHNSINKTVLQSLLNIGYDESHEFFKNHGETVVLRYDWEKGDDRWVIEDKYTPE
ncbi:MAG: phosphoglycerate mutase family protein [Candidatus Dojkabacteria bacterium]|jgi:broad specificity phosphatase PhoE